MMFGLIAQVGVQIGVQKQIFDTKGQSKPVIPSQPSISQQSNTPSPIVVKDVKSVSSQSPVSQQPNTSSLTVIKNVINVSPQSSISQQPNTPSLTIVKDTKNVPSQPSVSQQPNTPSLTIVKDVKKDDSNNQQQYKPKPIFIPKQNIEKPKLEDKSDIKEKIKSKFKRNFVSNKPVFTPPTSTNSYTYVIPKFTRKPITSVSSISLKKTTTVPKTDPTDYSYFLFSKYLANNNINVTIEIIINDTKSIYVDPLHIKYFREYLTFTKYTNTYILRIVSPSSHFYNDLLNKNNKIVVKVTIYNDNGNKLFENNYIPLSIVSNIVNVTNSGVGNNTSSIFDITMVSELFLKMYRNYTFRKYVNMTQEEILHDLQKSYNYTAKTTNTTIVTNDIIYKYSNMNDIDFLKYLSNIASSGLSSTTDSIFDIYHFYVHDNSLLSVNTNYFKNNPIVIDSQYVPFLKTTNYTYNTVPQLTELLTLSYDIEKINILTNSITKQSDIVDSGHMYRSSFTVFNDSNTLIELEMIKKNRKKFNILQNTMIVVIPINIPNLTIFSYIKVVNDIQIQKLGFQEGIVLGYFADVHNTESLLFTTVLIIHKLK